MPSQQSVTKARRARPRTAYQAHPTRRRKAERRAEQRALRRDQRERERRKARRAARQRRAARHIAGALLGVAGLLASGAILGGSTVPGLSGPFLAIKSPLKSYEVTYKTVYPGAPEVIEEDLVDEPFKGIYLVKRGRRIEGGYLSNDQGLWSWSLTGKAPGWSPIQAGLVPATQALQPVPTLNLAISRNEAAIVGQSTVLGHHCTIVETGAPPGDPVTAPTPGNYASYCISKSGIVLYQRWMLQGKVAQTKTAISYTTHPHISPSTFAALPRASESSSPAVKAVALSATARSKMWPKLRPFDGLYYVGGWVREVSGPSPALVSTDELFASQRGPRLIEVKYEGYRSTPPGISVGAGRGHSGSLQLELMLDQLTIATGPQSSVVLEGTDPNLLEKAALHLSWKR
ncbi:MAG: hypothetical protein M1115_04665 [Actinobacteria bacterium]|nr:hypothetical protein [Actinomycetota bacterium]